MADKELQLSADNITKISFGGHAKEYEDAIIRRRDIKKQLASIEREARAIRNEYGIGEGMDLQRLTVYAEPTALDEEVELVIDSQFGNKLMDLVVDPEVMILFNKRFNGLGKFLEKCHEAWQVKTGKRRPEVDKKRTKEAKKKLLPLADKHDKLRVELDTLNQNLDDVEKVVDFYDKVAKLSKYQKQSEK